MNIMTIMILSKCDASLRAYKILKDGVYRRGRVYNMGQGIGEPPNICANKLA